MVGPRKRAQMDCWQEPHALPYSEVTALNAGPIGPTGQLQKRVQVGIWKSGPARASNNARLAGPSNRPRCRIGAAYAAGLFRAAQAFSSHSAPQAAGFAPGAFVRALLFHHLAPVYSRDDLNNPLRA